jgi:hypothetical protein
LIVLLVMKESRMSNEEHRPATEAEMNAAREYFGALTSGLCPECGQAVEEEQQRGRSVYALPCEHRMYQGKAKKKGAVSA